VFTKHNYYSLVVISGVEGEKNLAYSVAKCSIAERWSLLNANFVFALAHKESIMNRQPHVIIRYPLYNAPKTAAADCGSQ
jgi:hypothetical protein